MMKLPHVYSYHSLHMLLQFEQINQLQVRSFTVCSHWLDLLYLK